ncbi:MAG: hypothetical protein Kow0031_36560 [Anaerolineae bacterium]
MIELHEKYAPILHFNKDEQFFPMRVDDLLSYSGLYAKDSQAAIVRPGELTPELLVKHGATGQAFVRSVETGPLLGKDVISQWGDSAVEMVLRWAQGESGGWSSELAQKTYSWVSAKTRAAADQFWWNNVIAAAVAGNLQTAAGSELPRLVLPAATHQNAVERYRDTTKRAPGYTYYYRYLKDSSYLYLQYWFFYAYNDWGQAYNGLNDHEGDWESMILFFRLRDDGQPQEPPAYVAYATHESRIHKPWGHPDIETVGNHVCGFIGAGSHATYPQAITYNVSDFYKLYDYATGDGIVINHDQWQHRINVSDVPWLAQYQGSWGTRFWLSTAQAKTVLQLALAATPLSGLIGLTVQPREFELPGVSAPRGPADRGRRQNTDPLGWAGLTETDDDIPFAA